MNVSLNLMSSCTYLQNVQRMHRMKAVATHLSSLWMISKRTSCRVRSRDPMLETRSPSVTSLHDAAARILLPLVFWDMVEYGVFERKDGEDPASNDF